MEQGWITKTKAIKCGKYGKISKHNHGFKHWIKEGHLTTKEGRADNGMNSTFFNVSELDNLMTKIEDMEKNYLSEKEVAKILGYKITLTGNSEAGRKKINQIITLCNSEKIQYKYLEKGFNKAFLYVNKEQFLHFVETHISNAEIAKKYNINHMQFDIVDRRYNLKKIRLTREVSYYRVEDVKCFEMFNENLEDYYTLEEAQAVHGMTGHVFRSIADEEGIEPLKLSSKKVYYSKKVIDGLVEKMEEIKEKYCSASKIKEVCGVKVRKHTETFTPIKTTALIRYVFRTIAEYVYSVEEVREYKNKLDMQDKIKRILLEKTSIKAFEEWLELREISFSGNSPYTEREWYSYCKEKLSLSTSTKKSRRTLIRTYVDCTELLANLTLEKELYSFTSNEINLKLFNSSIGVATQQYLYSFLKEFHAKLVVYLKKKEERKKTFDMDRIINPYKYEAVEQPKEVYEYDEYIKVYDYVQKEEHKHKAIIDAEKIIAGKSKKGISYYASAWLYVLAHLGNAWRHGDIMDMPMVDFNSVGIESLETLKARDLTEEEANAVINQIKRKNLTTNKTGAVNRFNCPKELVVPFATAAVICSIIAKRTSLVITSEITETKIIDFGIKDDIFSKKAHNTFFENFEIKDFQFQSRKMNRTILVLIYMVFVKNSSTT